MTTVGLELTSFIDPSLTWKRVSKGRNKVRRSRNMKVVPEQEEKGPKQLDSSQSSEDSEKSNEMIHGRRLAGNMEHIPIKKRRLFIRSPSPPLQSPNWQGEGHVPLESVPMHINASNGSGLQGIKSDAIIDESSVKSLDKVHGTSDDFSGIAILAAAACSDRLDHSSDYTGKSQTKSGGPLDKQHELFEPSSDIKESISGIESSELLGKDEKHVEEICVGDLSKDTVQISLNGESDVGVSLVNASHKVEQDKSVDKESLDEERKLLDDASDVKKIQSFESLGKDAKHFQEVSEVYFPKEIDQISVNKESDVGMSSINSSQKVEEIKPVGSTSVDKTPENSSASRECRLHWDLNTTMDEWDDPVEDTGVVSSSQAFEVEPINITGSQNLEDLDGCKASEPDIQNLKNAKGSEASRPERTESCDDITTQVKDFPEHERTESSKGFSSVSPPSKVSPGIVTSILKENSSPSNVDDHVEETPILDINREIKHTGVNKDANINCSLFLGPSGMKGLASEETNNGAICENTNQVAEEETPQLQIVTEIDRGYDSHLEDGELRDTHYWEDNEGEEVETEHVDYDSDNRDGSVFCEAGNDSVQLSGENMVKECEKQSYSSDNCSPDDQPNSDMKNDENCSMKFKGHVSNMDSMEAIVCTRRDSPPLKTCSEAVKSDKVDMDQKDCKSNVKVDRVRKDFENDPSCNARGASASGRDLQFSDGRCADSIRRSRSSNFDCMQNSDDRDESRSQQLSERMGRFVGRSWNSEQRRSVGNTASEDDSERIIRSRGDTSPLKSCRPRIINTSRSGCQFARRGSLEERDGEFSMGMIKARDFSPDNNPRNRFRRFGVGRGGFREGYRRPNVGDTFKSGGSGGGPMMNRFSKRDRSFSPVGDRFHRNRSRSRTRSPDFRSDARMGRGRGRGRGRLPYQQSNHAPEHLRERRSPPLREFNPTQRFDTIRPAIRSMRFHDTTTSGRVHDFSEGDDFRRKPILIRNNRRSRSRSRSCSPEFRSDTRVGPMRVPFQQPTDQIRQRRSPVRVLHAKQRYEAGGSPVRLRFDECSRMMVQTVRVPDSAQSGRGHDFNNNSGGSSNINRDEYRRKPRNIFERIHPIRHYEMEGDVRRFPYEEEGTSTQNFQRNEKYVRGPGERRPLEFRGPREERGNVRYNNNNNNNSNNDSNNSDTMFYPAPKQQYSGGMRDYGGEEGIPRRVRP